MPISKSKLITVLKTLSQEELKSFELFLKSPYCNTNKNLPRLVEKIKNYHPKYDSPKLDKEKLFYRILPKGKFSDRRMNNILSEAYLALERFLIFQRLRQSQNLQRDILLKELKNRRLEEAFFKDTDKEIARIESKKIKNWEDHLHLLKLYQQIYYHPNRNADTYNIDTLLKKRNEHISTVFLLEKAAIINEKIFRSRILKGEKYDIAKEIENWKLACGNRQDLAIELYKLRFDYTKENRFEQYLKLREKFLDEYKKLNEQEQKIHLVSLLNDTIVLIKANLIDITEMLPLYKIGLKTEMLLYKNVLNNQTFVAIVAASNTKQDFIYTKSFIEKYIFKLEKEFQSDAKSWAFAHTKYYEKRLLESLDILINHNFDSIYFQLLGKILTTQVYFDLFLIDNTYQEFLFNYFNSFEKWLLRERFRAKEHKSSYLKFVQICRAFVKNYVNSNFQKTKMDELLQNQQNVQALNWLDRKRLEILKLKGEAL